MIGPQVGPYFQASTFLKFGCDGAGAISLPIFAQYITQHNSNMQLVRWGGRALYMFIGMVQAVKSASDRRLLVDANQDLVGRE